MKKILILASNPRKDLNLDREIRDLKGVIEKSRHREQFEVVTELAVRVEDLQDLMLKHEPQIVHFCGHGGGEEGLVFESDEAKEQWLKTDALSNLFRLCARHVECVLLNACYSEVQANAMIEHINYVIGMNQTIQDNAAIAFSKGFYRALGYDRPIEESFEFGCNAIQLEITGSSKVRSTATETERKLGVINAVNTTVIPEDLKPILKKKANLTPFTPVSTLTQERRTEIQLEVAQSLTENSASDQYRAKVREFLADRKLSDLEKIRLERLRKDLGLSEAEAKQIVAEELEPILKAQDEYEEMLIRLIEAGHYPFSSEINNELQIHIQDLGLTQEEVETIAQPILKAAEQDYQEKLRSQEQQRQQEHQANLQRYEQEFGKAIAGQYPIDTFVRNGLKAFQQSLGLSNEAVDQIEKPLIAPKEAAYQQQLAEEKRKRDAERQQQQREQELKRQRELEQQRQEEERRRQEEAKRRPPLTPFEFQIATVNISTRLIEKPGWLGKKTETETTVNITRQPGQAEAFVEDLGNGVTLEMVKIPGGTFMMGAPEGEAGRSNDEGPPHQVTLSPFLIGKFAVTQAQWRSVAGFPKVNRDLDPDPSHFKGANRPVEQVSWEEAVEFCDRLNRFAEARLSRKTGKQYRLPSEAEWEYACRAGTTTPFHFGETITTDLANYHGNYTYGSGSKGQYREQTTDVGSFPPNAFGLYDMHGNVWEWCADRWHETYQGAPNDGSAWITGDSDYWLFRGGSWYDNPGVCRSAYRDRNYADDRYDYVGFRLACFASWTA